MSKRSRERKKQQAKEPFQKCIKDLWSEKKQILLLVLGFAALMGIFYGFWFSEVFTTNILEPVVKLNAVIASAILNIFGFGTIASGANISSATSGFAVTIKNGCDALEPIAIFTAISLLAPVSWKSKLYGIGFGIPALLLLNQVRIITLYISGIYSPSLFEILHMQVWQAVFIIITLMIIMYWLVWATGKRVVQHE